MKKVGRKDANRSSTSKEIPSEKEGKFKYPGDTQMQNSEDLRISGKIQRAANTQRWKFI